VSQPEGGRRFTSQPDQRPTRRYEPEPAATGTSHTSRRFNDGAPAGLTGERDVRPAPVAAWAGRRVLAESGRIDEVARRLGMSSLDRTARFIAFDWQDANR
jgi:hypothetical protein